jgi:hypothetical protein
MRALSKVAAFSSVRLPDEEAAWRQAARFARTNLPETKGRPAGEDQWRRAWRLTRLVDHADLFLSLSRTSAWARRYVSVTGAWPLNDPFLAITNHWGAGWCSLRYLRESGHRARYLLRGIVESDLQRDRCLVNYMKLRVVATRRALGTPLIYTGNASEEIVRTWASGTSVVGLFDVPSEPGRASISAEFGQGSIKVPLGLIRLACEHRVPVVTFAAGVDRNTGRRNLTIDPAQIWTDPAELAASLARHLDSLLRNDSASWHMWPYAGELLGP